MSGGYMGKVLWVDLSSGSFSDESIPEEVYKKFLTGYGLGAKCIFDRMKPGADPLGPDNILGFTSGLLTGTGALFAGRFMVVGKSPLTGGWGDANSGGFFSPEIKRTGYDAIFFTGASERPVYLAIKDGKKELKDASHVWGKDTYETEEVIRKEMGDEKVQVACIGPSGENMSLISGVVTDKGRIAARSGLGAVMGSKKLKAVALRGKERIPVANRDEFMSHTRAYMKRFKAGEGITRLKTGKLLGMAGKLQRKLPFRIRMEPITWRIVLRRYGTMGATALSAENGDSPVKNWKGVGMRDFPLNKSSMISDEIVLKYEKKKYACYSCPCACGAIMEITDGPYDIKETHKVEYETLCAFGTLLLNDDLHSIFKANDLCNQAGMDTISAGATIAFAVECFENGILTTKDTSGMELNWGNGEAVVKLLEMMIKREGIGNILADGVKVASKKIGKGSDKYAIHAGGQELPMHDPRNDPGFGTHYQVEPTPGRHTIASYYFDELMQIDRRFRRGRKLKALFGRSDWLDPSNKSETDALSSKFVQVGNGAGMCLFGLQTGGFIPVFEWINAAAGWNLSQDDFLEIGERIETLRHAFNVREGIKPGDFKSSPRAIGDPPLDEGPDAGITLDMDTRAGNFFKQFDWDYSTGKPSKERLKELGLEEVIEALY